MRELAPAWVCTADFPAITFVTDVDVSDPLAGVHCHEVLLPAGTSKTGWRAFYQTLRILLAE